VIETVGIYEFAKAVGHSVKHVYEQIRLGKIRARKDEHGKWQIDKSTLAEKLQDQRNKAKKTAQK